MMLEKEFRPDYRAIIENINQNWQVFSTSASLTEFLTPFFPNEPVLLAGVILAYETGILSFFRQDCHLDGSEVGRMIVLLSKNDSDGLASYEFWKKVCPELTMQSVKYGLSCSPVWHKIEKTQADGNRNVTAMNPGRKSSNNRSQRFGCGCFFWGLLLIVALLIGSVLVFSILAPDAFNQKLSQVKTEGPSVLLTMDFSVVSSTPEATLDGGQNLETATITVQPTPQVTKTKKPPISLNLFGATPTATLTAVPPTVTATATALPPTATKILPTPTKIITEVSSLQKFLIMVDQVGASDNRRYIVKQELPAKEHYKTIEDVFTAITALSDPTIFPEWELQLVITGNLTLPAYTELPPGYRLTGVKILNGTGNSSEKGKRREVKLSGPVIRGLEQVAGTVEGFGVGLANRVVGLFNKENQQDDVMIANWCNDQVYLFAHPQTDESGKSLVTEKISGSLRDGPLPTPVPTSATGAAVTEKISAELNDFQAMPPTVSHPVPKNVNSLIGKETRMRLMIPGYESVLVTNGIPLEIGAGVTLERNSIYVGGSTRYTDATLLPTDATVRIVGTADVIYLGGIAYHAQDRVHLNSSLAEIVGSVRKVFGGGLALDYETTAITDHPEIRFQYEFGIVTAVHEIRTGGVNFSVGGSVDGGVLEIDSSMNPERVEVKEGPLNLCP